MACTFSDINAKFIRITTVPLETKYSSQLDKHSTKLLEVIRSKTVDITIRRECEPVENLIKEYQENEVEELEQTTMAIFITEKEDPLHPPEEIKIVTEGTEVLNELPLVATAFAMVFGLLYTLNLKYPKRLHFTFEFVQKVLMELDGKRMTKKVNRLSTQLYSTEVKFSD